MNIACSECGTRMSIDASELADRVCPSCRAGVSRSAQVRAASWRTVSTALKVQFAIVVFWIALGGAMVAAVPPRIPEGNAMICATSGSFCLYLLCLCMCGAVPDPAARRSIVACILIPLLGSFCLAIGWQVLLTPQFRIEQFPVAFWFVQTVIGLAVFAVYFPAFVFLARFHALVACAFGNRRLMVEAQAFLVVPIVAIAANIVLHELSSRGQVPVRAQQSFRNPFEIAQTAFNFGVAVWYVRILWKTFRTIDRGPVVEFREPDRVPTADDDIDDEDASLG